MKFEDFKKQLNGIKYAGVVEWKINLPFKTKQETIQKLLNICRDNLTVNWHIYYPEPTEQNPEPDIEITWS